MTDEAPKKVDPAYPSGGGALGVGHDAAIGTLGAAASFVMPLSGPVVQALLKKCVQAPLEVRRAAWFNMIGEGLRELQDRFDDFDPDRLAENEEFVSVVAETTRIAMATHRVEKLEALRNAALNTAIGLNINDVQRGIFIQLLEQFSWIHIDILRTISNLKQQTVGIPHSFEMKFQDDCSTTVNFNLLFNLEQDAVDAVFETLYRNNLMSFNRAEDREERYLGSRLTTKAGNGFLRFISDPTPIGMPRSLPD